MKKTILTSVLVLTLPLVALAQNREDDLYFTPKKKSEKVTTQKMEVAPVQETTTAYGAAPTTVVLRDASGKERDIDEYNRRYTSRDNNFTVEDDVLYVEEKPLNERGEWVNGFEGSQDDYEYAMRIVRFRNPRYAIPVSSPLYWDIVYGLPSWNWNVYDDGLYAYAFPTFSNRLWWDWRWSSPSWGFGWSNSWYGNSWYGGYWGGGYWGSGWGIGWGGGYWGGHWGHHHHYPVWGATPYRGHGYYGSTAHNPGIHAGRYNSNLRGNSLSSHARSARTNAVRTSPSANTRQVGNRTATSGRVVTSRQEGNSVRPTTRTVRNSDGRVERTSGGRTTTGTYTRPSSTTGVSSSYDRPSSTRTTTRSAGTNSSSSETNRTYRTSSENSSRNSESSSRSSNSYNSGSSRSSSGGSSFSGGSSRSSSGGSYGGGASRSGGGGSSRGR